MKPLLIVKMGSTFSALRREQGDCDAWIAARINGSPLPLATVDARTTDPLPAADALAGAILSGSHAMVTDRHDWSERAALWLRGLVESGVPVLGICYGHQLLAHALGGKVADTPLGPEFGTVAVTLAAETATDLLLGGLPSTLAAQVCHCQSVVRLPVGAVRLAQSPRDPNHAFRIGASAWGVQFHPEYTLEVTRRYAESARELLVASGQDADAVVQGCAAAPYTEEIINRFALQALRRG